MRHGGKSLSAVRGRNPPAAAPGSVLATQHSARDCRRCPLKAFICFEEKAVLRKGKRRASGEYTPFACWAAGLGYCSGGQCRECVKMRELHAAGHYPSRRPPDTSIRFLGTEACRHRLLEIRRRGSRLEAELR